MSENKMPEFESVEELVEFFDNNDMSEYSDEMPEVHFDVDIQRRSFLVSVDKQLMKRLAEVAKAQHTSTEQLVNTWLEEKADQAA
jgi:predicted HicB family RNase H-like nuclease